MGLTPHEYYSMTRAEFIIKAKGFRTKEVKQWEHTRYLAYNVYKFVPMRGKNNRPVSITKFLPLETDKQNHPQLSPEERKAKWERLKKNESKANRTS